MIVIGGYNGSERLGDVWVYDFDSYHWTELYICGHDSGAKATLGSDGHGAGSEGYHVGFVPEELEGEGMFPPPPPTTTATGADGTPSGDTGMPTTLSRAPRTSQNSAQLDLLKYYSKPPESWCRPSGRSSLVCEIHNSTVYLFGGYNGSIVLNDFYSMALPYASCPPPDAVSFSIGTLFSAVCTAEADDAALESTADVTFAVEGSEIKGNRAVLACRSEYFKMLLTASGMRESVDKTALVSVDGIEAHVFVKVLEFLYTGKVEDLSRVAVPLLMASEVFLLDELKLVCEERVRKDVSLATVCGLLMTAERYRAEGLKSIALKFIVENLEEVKLQKEFLELTGEPELLMEILMMTTGAAKSSRDK